MSRTRAHRPERAWFDDPSICRPAHDHRDGPCDLPRLADWFHWLNHGDGEQPWRCEWELRWDGGPKLCGCRVCSGYREPTVAAALVEIRLADPVPQTAVGDAEIAGDLLGRLLAHPGELNSSLTELRRMRCRHLDSFPTTNVASASVSVNPGDLQHCPNLSPWERH